MYRTACFSAVRLVRQASVSFLLFCANHKEACLVARCLLAVDVYVSMSRTQELRCLTLIMVSWSLGLSTTPTSLPRRVIKRMIESVHPRNTCHIVRSLFDSRPFFVLLVTSVNNRITTEHPIYGTVVRRDHGHLPRCASTCGGEPQLPVPARRKVSPRSHPAIPPPRPTICLFGLQTRMAVVPGR